MTDALASECQRLTRNIRDKKPAFDNTAALVTLIADKDGTEFVVHKEFACYHSPVLKAAFNSDFIEGQTQRYNLEGAGKITVALLLQWFYKDMLEPGIIEGMKMDDNHWDPDQFVYLWVLADKLIIPSLQNKVVSMIHTARIFPSSCAICFIYVHTAADSKLRRFIVHQFIRWRKSKSLYEPKRLPADMILEIAKELMERNDQDQAAKWRWDFVPNRKLYEVPENHEEFEAQEEDVQGQK